MYLKITLPIVFFVLFVLKPKVLKLDSSQTEIIYFVCGNNFLLVLFTN